jgi:hypothetical protein
MRILLIAASMAAAWTLTGCLNETPLADTLKFPPGVDIEFKGKPAKLYGTSQCAQSGLTGNSCLIFSPHDPQATGIIISAKQAHEVQLVARRDPEDPVRYVVLDTQGERLLSTTGRHDEYANLDITP